MALAATPLAAQAQPFQGLYVGAGAGVYLPNNVDVSTGLAAPPHPKINPSVGFAGLGSFGYALGNGFRFEVEGNYRQGTISSGTWPGEPASFSGRLQTYGAMVNALYDMDVGVPWLYPYIGGGVGYAWSHLSSFRVTPSAPGSGVVTSDDTQGSFAWQAIAGLAFPIPNLPGLSLTAEYRFFGALGGQSYAATVTPPGAPFTVKPQHQYQQQLPVRCALCVRRCRPSAGGGASGGAGLCARPVLSGVLRLGQGDTDRSGPLDHQGRG